jgi:hypothetical protein
MAGDPPGFWAPRSGFDAAPRSSIASATPSASPAQNCWVDAFADYLAFLRHAPVRVFRFSVRLSATTLHPRPLQIVRNLSARDALQIPCLALRASSAGRTRTYNPPVNRTPRRGVVRQIRPFQAICGDLRSGQVRWVCDKAVTKSRRRARGDQPGVSESLANQSGGPASAIPIEQFVWLYVTGRGGLSA